MVNFVEKITLSTIKYGFNYRLPVKADIFKLPLIHCRVKS